MAPEVGKKWCVPRTDASDAALQSNIDFVCSSGIDCQAIQDGGPCFEPNTIRAHASYAMNAYYQANGGKDFDCNFINTGVVTIYDPSKFFLRKLLNSLMVTTIYIHLCDNLCT